ncbi:MAG: MAPEG family protein [Alcanivorax sp.]|uniref:MAPEG family protein n=1 Tax=Alcanivorax sp. TaxID=1872427 RepID=UPI00262A3BC6|nr:MAPEG family protein [Alcanivorax sp.]MDF1723939.1 MAPEG family protein [Alcanivorax sp.]
MTGMTALLIYIVWTLILALSYATYRLPLVLTGKKAANHWERGNAVDDPAILVRAKAAHLNCLENLPLFAALVLVAAAIGQSETVNAVAGFIVAARIGQSLVHLIGTSFPLVFVRASLFLAQVALMLYLAFALL